MARRKRYNPERRAWRGKSYRKGGCAPAELRYRAMTDEGYKGPEYHTYEDADTYGSSLDTPYIVDVYADVAKK